MTKRWDRRRYRRFGAMAAVLGLVAGAMLLYLLDGRYGALGFCGATAEVRLQLADTDPSDQAAVAMAAAPSLRARVDRLVWPRDDLAPRIVEALEDAGATAPEASAADAIHRFVRLDNEFRADHCNSRR